MLPYFQLAFANPIFTGFLILVGACLTAHVVENVRVAFMRRK